MVSPRSAKTILNQEKEHWRILRHFESILEKTVFAMWQYNLLQLDKPFVWEVITSELAYQSIFFYTNTSIDQTILYTLYFHCSLKGSPVANDITGLSVALFISVVMIPRTKSMVSWTIPWTWGQHLRVYASWTRLQNRWLSVEKNGKPWYRTLLICLKPICLIIPLYI